MLSWKCLSDIQGEMLSKQLGTQVWNSGEKLGKAVKIKSHWRIRWFQSCKTEWGHQGNEYREKVRGVRTGALWNKRSGERRDQPGWTWRTGQREEERRRIQRKPSEDGVSSRKCWSPAAGGSKVRPETWDYPYGGTADLDLSRGDAGGQMPDRRRVEGKSGGA